VLQQVFRAVVIVPIMLADQHEAEILGFEPPGFHQDLHGAEVVALREW
jgi:hypothetical protein